MAMGVFEVQDLAGLDIGAAQRKAARARGETPFAPVADRLVAAGRLGRKRQRLVRLRRGARPARSAGARCGGDRRGAGGGGAGAGMDGRGDRRAIVLPMVDEAAQIVAEGIAQRPSDVDLVMVHGYGFPRFRGGPVQYGQSLGFAQVVTRLEALHADGCASAPSDALRRWADDQSAPLN